MTTNTDQVKRPLFILQNDIKYIETDKSWTFVYEIGHCRRVSVYPLTSCPENTKKKSDDFRFLWFSWPGREFG